MTRCLSSRAVLAFLLISGPLCFGAVEGWAAFLMIVGTCVLFATCALRSEIHLVHPIHRTLLPAIVLLLALGCVQWLSPRSFDAPGSVLPFSANADATARALGLWFSYGLLVATVPMALPDVSSGRQLMWCLFILGAVIASIGIVQSSQSPSAIYGLRKVPYGFEPFGPYYNRDHAASFLLMSSMCGVGLIWEKTLRICTESGPSRSEEIAKLLLATSALALTLGGLLFTLSRGALVSFVAVAAVIAFASFRRSRYRAPALLLGGVGVGLAVFYSPIITRLTPSYLLNGLSFRAAIYDSSFRLFLDFPAFGVGLGSFQHAYYPYQPSDIAGLVQHVHSDWLELLTQTGLVGFCAFALGLVVFLRFCLARWENLSWRQRPLVVGLAAGASAFMLHGLIDFGFQTPANAAVFFILLGMLDTLVSPEKAPAHTSLRLAGRGRIVAVALVGAVAVLALPTGAASWIEASSSNHANGERLSALDRAIRLHPDARYHAARSRLFSIQARESGGGAVETLRRALWESLESERLDRRNPAYESQTAQLVARLRVR